MDKQDTSAITDELRRAWTEAWTEIGARILSHPAAPAWLRLHEILSAAKGDGLIKTAPPVSDFIEVLIELVSDALTAASVEQAFQPLIDVSPEAQFGKPFKANAERNAKKSRKKISPLRKAIARELKQSPALKPREVWERVKSRAPKTWEFSELGERREWCIWITGRPKTGYGTFSGTCKQERDKLQA